MVQWFNVNLTSGTDDDYDDEDDEDEDLEDDLEDDEVHDTEHVASDTKECEMNQYGECLSTQEDTVAKEAFRHENAAVRQKEKVAASSMEHSMFGSEAEAAVGEGKRPIYNRKYFSPRDIRSAANLGQFYLL